MKTTIKLLICLAVFAGCSKETGDNTFVITGHDFPFLVKFPVYKGDKNGKTFYIPKDSFCSYTWESQKYKRGEHPRFEFSVMSGNVIVHLDVYGDILEYLYFEDSMSNRFSVDVDLNGSTYYSGMGSVHNISKSY